MNDPNPNQNNADEYTDVYEGKDTIVYYDLDGDQHVEIKEE